MQRRTRRIKSKYMHRPKNLEWLYRRSPGLKNRIVFVSIHEVFSTVYKGNHTKSTSLIDRSMRLVGKLGLCRALGRWKQVKIACAKTVSLLFVVPTLSDSPAWAEGLEESTVTFTGITSQICLPLFSPKGSPTTEKPFSQELERENRGQWKKGRPL